MEVEVFQFFFGSFKRCFITISLALVFLFFFVLSLGAVLIKTGWAIIGFLAGILTYFFWFVVIMAVLVSGIWFIKRKH